MSVLNKIAYIQGITGEIPNQELARELVESENKEGIKEIVENLFNKNKNIQCDCIKVLYEAGYIKPEIIAQYAGDFIKLLKSSNNRLVWGAMIALSSISSIKADDIFENLEAVYEAMKVGSVITVDNGVKVLAAVASQKEEYNKIIFPYLINHLKTCRPKEVPQHAESIIAAVNPQNKNEFISVLKDRETSLTSTQLARIKKLYKLLTVSQ